MSIKKVHKGLQKKVTRKDLLSVESKIASHPDAFFGDSDVCPVKHSFADGIYVREIFIPKGTLLTGKIHKHEHPNFLMKGTVEVATEDGVEILKAPVSMISKAGTKRALLAITDLIWVTCHKNETNTQDLKELEAIVIADSYEEYDKFIKNKNIIS